MNILENEKNQINNIPTTETRKGANIAATLYSEGIEKIKYYEENAKFKKGNEEEKFTSEMLKDIQTKVEGRETMGEVEPEKTLYTEDERDI